MKQHSDLILTSDITSTFPGPLDNKMIVNSVADLTDAASWKIYNSRLQMQMSLWYPQMLVIVKSEDATAGVYQFSGTEEYELEDIGKWRKLAFADDIVAPPSADTIKGDWEPDVDGSGITNYPGANNAYRVTGNAAQALGIEIGDIVFINETNTGTTAVLKAVNAVLNTDAIQEGAINKYYPPSDREKLDTIEVGAQKNVDPDWDDVQNKPFIPSDIVDLTDVAGRIPADVSQLSDAEGILTSELPNLSSVVGGTITEALNTLKTANTTVKGEWEPILLGEEPIQNLFHQVVPDPIAGSGNPSVSIQDGGKSLLGISNSPGVDWTNVLYFSPAQVSLKFKTTLNSSMGPNTAVSVGHFNSDENRVSEMVAGLNMYSDNKIAVMFVEYDEPNGSVIQTQATAKADVGVDSLDEIYVFILGDDLIVHVNDTEVARATFSNGAPTTTASVTQSKMLCASIGLDDTLEMLEIIPVAMNYPAQFANNAFTIVGNALSPIADDGDIVIGNKAGDGIAKVIGKSAGGGSGSDGSTIKGTWKPTLISDAPIATLDRLIDVGDGLDGVSFDDTSISAPQGFGSAVSTLLPTSGKLGIWSKYAAAEMEYAYYMYIGFVSQADLDGLGEGTPSLLLAVVIYDEENGLAYTDDFDGEDPQFIADWDPVVDSVAVVFDADNRTISYYTNRNNQAPILSFDLAALGITTVPEFAMLSAMGGTVSGAKTFDIDGVQSVFGSEVRIDENNLPENAADNFYRLELASPAYLTSLELTVADGDIVAFSPDGQPLRVIQQVVIPPAPNLSRYARKADLAPVATTGNYYDLENRPQSLSSFTNDVGFITSAPTYSAGEGLVLTGDEFALSPATLAQLDSIPKEAVEVRALLARELIQLPYNVPPNSVLAMSGFKASYVAPNGECRLYNTQENGDVHYSVVDPITGIVSNSVVAETSAASVLLGRRIIAASSHIIAVQQTSNPKHVSILNRNSLGVWGTEYTSSYDTMYGDVMYAEIIVRGTTAIWLILDSSIYDIRKAEPARELTGTFSGQLHRGISHNRILSTDSIGGRLAFRLRDPNYWHGDENAIATVITSHAYSIKTDAIVIGGGVIFGDIVSGEVQVGNNYRLRFGRVGYKEELLLTYESAAAMHSPTGYHYTNYSSNTQAIRLPRGKTLIRDTTGLILARQGSVQSDSVVLPPTTPPTAPNSRGAMGQTAEDADYLYYCYAKDSWASIPKNQFKTGYGSMALFDDAASDGKAYARKGGAWVEAVDKSSLTNSDNLPEGTTNRYNKPRTPLALTDDITIVNDSNQGDLFVVPNTQVTPIEIELLDLSTSDYFYFTIKNKSSQAVTFSDGSNPIVDAYGFGSVTQGGLVTVLWDGNEWMISGGLD